MILYKYIRLTACQLVVGGHQRRSHRRVKRDALSGHVAENGRVDYILKFGHPQLVLFILCYNFQLDFLKLYVKNSITSIEKKKRILGLTIIRLNNSTLEEINKRSRCM